MATNRPRCLRSKSSVVLRQAKRTKDWHWCRKRSRHNWQKYRRQRVCEDWISKKGPRPLAVISTKWERQTWKKITRKETRTRWDDWSCTNAQTTESGCNIRKDWLGTLCSQVDQTKGGRLASCSQSVRVAQRANSPTACRGWRAKLTVSYRWGRGPISGMGWKSGLINPAR